MSSLLWLCAAWLSVTLAAPARTEQLASQWPPLRAPAARVTVPPHMRLRIDADVAVRELLIDGAVTIDVPRNAVRRIAAELIVVRNGGELRAGSADQPIAGAGARGGAGGVRLTQSQVN